MNKKTRTINYYKTKDQFVATLLYAMGEKLDSVERGGNICYLVFEDETRCADIARRYYNDDLKVSPRTLFSAFKDIKSIIFNN